MAVGSPVSHLHPGLKSNSKLTTFQELWPREGDKSERSEFLRKKNTSAFENPQFSKTMQLSMAGASQRTAYNRHACASDTSSKGIVLNPDKIRNFISKIQAKEKMEETLKSKSSKSKSNVRDLRDSKNLLSMATSRPIWRQTTEENQGQSKQLKNFDLPVNIKVPDALKSKADENSENQEGQRVRYFTGRCKSLTKLALKKKLGSQTELIQLEKIGTNSSVNFLRTIDSCLNQLETTQRAVSLHKRGKSSMDMLRCRHTSTVSHGRWAEGFGDGNVSINTAGHATDKPPSKGSNRNRESSLESSKKVHQDHPTEVDTLIAQNEALRQKISKLHSKIKEENICKEYWKEKFKDLEKRYNSIIMQNVRFKDDPSQGRKSAGGTRGNSDVRCQLPTNATADSNSKADIKR